MSKVQRTPHGEAFSELALEIFRLNSLLVTSADRLVSTLGLTSARWAVLGAIVAAERPQPVAWLARDLGANRQNVQRIVNDLRDESLVAFEPNPHHRRAPVVVLTAQGQQRYSLAMELQAPWANHLAEGLKADKMKTARAVVAALRNKLEAEDALHEEAKQAKDA